MKNFAVFAFLLLAGCTGQIMKGYIGKSIQEPILDYGPPINVIELGDDRRAYQWNIVTGGVVPVSGPSTTTYVPYSDSCVHTLTAKKSGDTYIVDGHRQTHAFCE
ncbi:MAG: hypothetical protein RIG26_04135 [Thalassospira sp.]|uniref:hypothetical protein n=1 Tax=Thalassospira sp. TaxID=1912094 RepID=UPI0032F04C76